jgi:hypothetical protein
MSRGELNKDDTLNTKQASSIRLNSWPTHHPHTTAQERHSQVDHLAFWDTQRLFWTVKPLLGFLTNTLHIDDHGTVQA